MNNAGDRRLQDIHHQTAAGTTLSRFSYAYDPLGNITNWTQQYATDVKAYDFTYDVAEQLTSAVYRTTDATPTVVKRYGYSYDPTGNRTTARIDDTPLLYAYNNMNRLTSQSGGGVVEFRGMTSEAASVTVAGKPATGAGSSAFAGSAALPSGTSTVTIAATDASGNTTSKSYEVDVPASTGSFTYDANGNLMAQGTKTYEWDAANRLVRVVDGSTEVARFICDGYGRRVQKITSVTKSYVYDGDYIAQERFGGATSRTIHDPGIDRPLASIDGTGVVSYYLVDHLGSVVQETTSSGGVSLVRQYDPNGVLLQSQSTSGYAFTGREWDTETGLAYHSARYFDAKAARFISEDPIQWSGRSDNFYTYVNNNPVRWTDPRGLSPSGGCCNQDWLGCVAKCLARYDPLGPAGNTVLTLAGGTFPKVVIGAPTVLGASRMTTTPSALGGAAVRGVGRFFSPIWMTYGLYLAGVEAHCFAACAGYACSY